MHDYFVAVPQPDDGEAVFEANPGSKLSVDSASKLVSLVVPLVNQNDDHHFTVRKLLIAIESWSQFSTVISDGFAECTRFTTSVDLRSVDGLLLGLDWRSAGAGVLLWSGEGRRCWRCSGAGIFSDQNRLFLRPGRAV